MEYGRVNRWLSVRDSSFIGLQLLLLFSIIFALFFFMIANINNTTDGQTLVVDTDADKQFDNLGHE